MGLSPATAKPGFAAAVAPAATGILDPSTGRPIGATDPYFLEVNHELSDKGFFVAAGIANWATSYAQTYFTGWTGERIQAFIMNASSGDTVAGASIWEIATSFAADRSRAR